MSKGYYVIHREFVENNDIAKGLAFCKAGGDLGLSYNEAIKCVLHELKNCIVVDLNGNIVFDPINIQ